MAESLDDKLARAFAALEVKLDKIIEHIQTQQRTVDDLKNKMIHMQYSIESIPRR